MKNYLYILFTIISIKASAQEQIFGTSYGGNLYSFDIINCTRNLIGFTGVNFDDIAFSPDGRLWGIAAGDLYKIDTSNANVTLIGPTGTIAVSLVSLNDSILLAENNLMLCKINVNNANTTIVGNIGYAATGDLTWYDDDLYLVTTTTGQMAKIKLNATNTAITNVTLIGSSIPVCQSAVTTSILGTDNTLVGFNDAHAIKICQIDGSTQPLCVGLNISGLPGATSFRLPTQIPAPTACSPVKLFEQNQNESMSSLVYPNPCTSNIYLNTNDVNISSVVIYDMHGRKSTANVDAKKIEVSNLSPGIYTIEIVSNIGLQRQLFVKE